MPTTPTKPQYLVERICTILHVPPERQAFLIRHWKPVLQLGATLLLFAWTIPSSIRHLNKHTSALSLSLCALFLLRILYEVFRPKPRPTPVKDHIS